MLKPYQIHLLHRLRHGLKTTRLIRTHGLRKRLDAYLLSQAQDGVVVRTLYGFSLQVDPLSDTGVDRAIFLRGTYEPGTLEVIQTCLSPGQVFVDVGANIGLMTLLAAQTVGDGGLVYSFEADPANFAFLDRNLKLNRTANVQAHNLALSSSAGRGLIYRTREAKGTATLAPMAGAEATEGVPIEMQTLDAFMAGQSRTQVRMIKVDVEGWEIEFLKGAAGFLSGPDAPILCLEYSASYIHDHPERDFYHYLRQLNGYRVFKQAKGKRSFSQLQEVKTDAELPDEDNLFCFLPPHLESLPERLFLK